MAWEDPIGSLISRGRERFPSLLILVFMTVAAQVLLPYLGRDEALFIYKWDLYSRISPEYFELLVQDSGAQTRLLSDENQREQSDGVLLWFLTQMVGQSQGPVRLEATRLLHQRLQSKQWQAAQICSLPAPAFPNYVLSAQKRESLNACQPLDSSL